MAATTDRSGKKELRHKYHVNVRDHGIWSENDRLMRSVLDTLEGSYREHADDCFLMRWQALKRMIKTAIAGRMDAERRFVRPGERSRDAEEAGPATDDEDTSDERTPLMRTNRAADEGGLVDAARQLFEDVDRLQRKRATVHGMKKGELEEAIQRTERKIAHLRMEYDCIRDKLVALEEEYETSKWCSFCCPCGHYMRLDGFVRTALGVRVLEAPC